MKHEVSWIMGERWSEKIEGSWHVRLSMGQPSVARFNGRQHRKAQALVKEKDLHLLDALSEVAYQDPILMCALSRADTASS